MSDHVKSRNEIFIQFPTVLSQWEEFFLPMILFTSVEANDWHLIGLAKLKTGISIGLDRDLIVFVCRFCDGSIGLSYYV